MSTVLRSNRIFHQFDRPSSNWHCQWVTVDNVRLPCLLREAFDPLYQHPSSSDLLPTSQLILTRYIPLRLLKRNIFRKYTLVFKQRLFDMLKTPVYNMTHVEASFYNHLLRQSCRYLLDYDPYTTKDEILLLQDVQRIVALLNFLATRPVCSTSAVHPNFGFVHFGDMVLYPYYMISGITYIPSLFFEGPLGATKETVLPYMVERIMRVLMYLQNKRIVHGRIKFLTAEEFNNGENKPVKVEQWILKCQDRILMTRTLLLRYGPSVFRIYPIGNDD